MQHHHFSLPAALAVLTLCGMGLLPCAAPCAQAEDVKQHIEVGKLPEQATVVDDVIVPVPTEVFGVLDKLGSPNWHDVLRPEKPVVPSARAETALLLGKVIAEGFIAVEAQDPEQVKKIGRTVLDLSTALGVRKAVTARSSASQSPFKRRKFASLHAGSSVGSAVKPKHSDENSATWASSMLNT